MRIGLWVLSVCSIKKAAAVLIGSCMFHEQAIDNQNNRRASSMVAELRSQGKTYTEIAERLNRDGFATSTGKEFHAMQVQRLHKRHKQVVEKTA
jgi:hypothetical protein